MFYGPGYIKPGTYDADATVADMAPTMAELMDFEEFPERDGRVLEEALKPAESRTTPPRLIFTLVWDGGGDNLLG
jgi:arylsulfatase A-like enzyme